MQTYFQNTAPMSGISAGALLGTAGTAALIDSINNNLGSSNFFGTARDTFSDIRNSFVENFVRPAQQTIARLTNMVNVLMNPDVIRPITSEDQLAAIPPCMQEAIVMYPPVRHLLEEGRIYGFGYDPAWLPEEDTWGRLINNGVCADVGAAFEEHGKVVVVSEHWSSDPQCTDEELDAVERTRDFIHSILENTMYDPTDFPEHRG